MRPDVRRATVCKIFLSTCPWFSQSLNSVICVNDPLEELEVTDELRLIYLNFSMFSSTFASNLLLFRNVFLFDIFLPTFPFTHLPKETHMFCLSVSTISVCRFTLYLSAPFLKALSQCSYLSEATLSLLLLSFLLVDHVLSLPKPALLPLPGLDSHYPHLWTNPLSVSLLDNIEGQHGYQGGEITSCDEYWSCPGSRGVAETSIAQMPPSINHMQNGLNKRD